MKTKTITLYEYDELSDKAKDNAVEKLYDINVDFDDWAQFVTDDAKETGKLIGINITDIYYSGFSSQGDGACFTGSYSYAKGGVKALKAYAPKDVRLHTIAETLTTIQSANFYKLTAKITHRGNYYHEYCTEIDVWHSDTGGYASKTASDALSDVLRLFMRWIYSTLQEEYTYLTTREAIEETIRANEYTFTIDGKLEN